MSHSSRIESGIFSSSAGEAGVFEVVGDVVCSGIAKSPSG